MNISSLGFARSLFLVNTFPIGVFFVKKMQIHLNIITSQIFVVVVICIYI